MSSKHLTNCWLQVNAMASNYHNNFFKALRREWNDLSKMGSSWSSLIWMRSHISILRKSYVLLMLSAVPNHGSALWARLKQVFTTSDAHVWVIVHMLSLCDAAAPLCRHIEVPLVKKAARTELVMLPAAAVVSPICLTWLPCGEEDGPATRYWVNWFISLGSFYYDEDRHFDYLTSHQLLAHVN